MTSVKLDPLSAPRPSSFAVDMHHIERMETEGRSSNEKEKTLRCMSEWLREVAPRGVLIPCAVGDKRPAFAYSNNSWNWQDFDRFVQTGKDADWAIVLHELCVVDVDSLEVATSLEERFPVLRDAPCEETARGFHYYFRRSSTADADGYWDGCAQVLHDVDFKSAPPGLDPTTCVGRSPAPPAARCCYRLYCVASTPRSILFLSHIHSIITRSSYDREPRWQA